MAETLEFIIAKHLEVVGLEERERTSDSIIHFYLLTSQFPSPYDVEDLVVYKGFLQDSRHFAFRTIDVGVMFEVILECLVSVSIPSPSP